MNSTKRISLNLGWGGSSSSSNNNNNSSSSTAAAASPASTSLVAPVSPLLVPPSSPGGGGFVGGFGGGISSASGRTSPQPSSFANEPQNVLWAGPAPLDREDLHKQLRSLETLLQQLGEYRLLLASLAKTEHKLAKAAKDVLTGSTFANAKDGGLMGSPEVIYHGLRSASNLYESLSEVTSKHAKTTSKEIVDLNDTLAKHFKRVSKLERAHDAHVMEYDAKIKQSGLKYEKAIKGVNRKESGMVVGEKHEKWIGQLKSLGENIAQANDSHTHEITRIQTLALLYTSTCLTTLASDQFTATAEGIKKTSPHLGDVGIWRAYAEARWVEGKSILDMELRPKGEPVAVAAAAAVVPVAASAAPAETESLRGPAESMTAVAVLPAAAAPPSPRVTEEVQTSRSWEDDTELKRIEAREKAQHEEDLALAAAAAADALRSAQAERKKEQQKQQQQSLEVPRDASNGTSQPSSPRTSQASPSKSAYRPLPTTSSSSSSLDLKPPERPFANESSSPSDRPPSRQSSVDQSFRPDLLPPPSPALSSSSSRPLPTRSQDSVRSIHTLERQQIQQAKANGYLYQQQQTATAVERGSTSSRSSSSRFGGEESSPDLGGPTTPMGSWPTSSGAAHGGGGGLLRGDPPGGGRPKKSVSIDPSPSEVIPDVDYFSRRQQEEEEAAAAAAREMQLRERERERERDQQLMAEAAATREWEAAERQRAHLMQQQQEEREREMERQRESIAISEARERERRERERERQIAEGSRIREMKGRFEDNRRYPSPPSPQPIVPSGAQLGRRVSLLSQHFDVPPSSTSSSNSGGYRPASPSTSVISASSAGQLHRPRPVSTQSYYPPQSVMSSSPHVRGARPHPASSSSMDRIAQLEPTRPLVLSASTRAARHSSFPLPGPYGSRNLASSIHHYTQQQAQRDARLNSDGDGGVGFFREEYNDDKGAEWERHQQYLAREESVHEGDLRFVSPPGSASGMGPSRWP